MLLLAVAALTSGQTGEVCGAIGCILFIVLFWVDGGFSYFERVLKLL